MLKISMIGGDIRQYYLLCSLLDYFSEHTISFQITYYQVPFKNHTICSIYPKSLIKANSLEDALSDCDVLIAPTPFSKDGVHLFSTQKDCNISISDMFDILNQNRNNRLLIGGNIPKNVTLQLETLNVNVADAMKDETVVMKNADLTAEGLLAAIIQNTECSIANSNILVLGYGKCGRKIAATLDLLGANILIYNRSDVSSITNFENISNKDDIEIYSQFDIIINTIPIPILKAPILRKLKQDCTIFEVASISGFDDDILKGLSIRYIQCPGIPGKTAPYSAGKILAEYVCTQLKQDYL